MPPTPGAQRCAELDAAAKEAFDKVKGLYGSPRLYRELRDEGWRVSDNTVVKSMARQDLVARAKKRRTGLTRQDKSKRPSPDLACRDFTAPVPNVKWVGDSSTRPSPSGHQLTGRRSGPTRWPKSPGGEPVTSWVK